MNKFNIFILSGVLALSLFSCADEDLAPIVTFDDAEKGAYVRLIEQGDNLINLFDIDGSVFTYSVEFIDVEQGNQVAEYNVDLVYTGSKGDIGPVRYKSFTQSDFGTCEEGYRCLENITVPATEVIAALGLTPDDLEPGDQIRADGSLVLTTGAVFGAENSSATVNGTAFRGFFDFLLPAGCPSDLEQTVTYETTDIWCGGDPVSGSVDIVGRGAGVYEFSDWAFGSYGPCYGGGTAGGDLTFSEVCGEVFFSGFTDSFADTWTFESSIDGNQWTIIWENTYGEAATSVITFPGDAVPFTLKD
ncbi:MAG: hypothetical protein AAGI23_04125 [Bacteroidota bacterium]